jgi:hypothetical protein
VTSWTIPVASDRVRYSRFLPNLLALDRRLPPTSSATESSKQSEAQRWGEQAQSPLSPLCHHDILGEQQPFAPTCSPQGG